MCVVCAGQAVVFCVAVGRRWCVYVWRAGGRVRGGWGDGFVLWLGRAVCLWHHGFFP